MENQNIKLRLTRSSRRIRAIRNEILNLGCTLQVNPEVGEMWITHLASGWKSYVRVYAYNGHQYLAAGWAGHAEHYLVQGLKTIDEAICFAWKVTREMKADYQAGQISTK